MTSTLCIRETPKAAKEWHFKQPIKGIIARRYYGHDGSCGGGMLTLGPEDLPWFEGVFVALPDNDPDTRQFGKIVDLLQRGKTIDLWFEQ